MKIMGTDRATAAQLDTDLARTRDLLATYAQGPVAIATESAAMQARICLAALSTGRAVLPLDPLAPAREIAPLLSRPAVLFADPQVANRWSLPDALPVMLVDPHARPSAWERLLKQHRSQPSTYPGCLDDLPQAPAQPTTQPPAADRLALLLQTSGTTGPARLVRWTHAALQAQLDTLTQALQLQPDDRLLNLLPTHHYDGLVMGSLLVHHLDATLIRVGPRVIDDLPGLLNAVWQERATHLITTPAVLALLLRVGEDLREVFGGRDFRCFISTAAPLPQTIWQRIEEATGKPVVNIYGLTETGNLFFAGPDDASRQHDSVGRAWGCELRLLGDSGPVGDSSQVGELWLRGPSVMSAYDDGHSPLVDGWYPTGDLASLGADGLLRLAGRSKAMLSVGGLKVQPYDVTSALLGIAGVTDAHVWGEPDRRFGDRVVAQVVVEEGGPDAASLTASLRGLLSEYKLPRRIEIVDHIGRGATGKTRPPQPPALDDRLLALAGRVFRAQPAQLSLATRPGDLPGWDSLGHLDLVDAIEAEFHLQLSAGQLLGLQSLADALTIIEAHEANRADG